MENEFELRDFDRNPELRKLLVNYCLTTYEENAITDDEHLIKEYNWLASKNKLEDLFSCEFLMNYYEPSITSLR